MINAVLEQLEHLQRELAKIAPDRPSVAANQVADMAASLRRSLPPAQAAPKRLRRASRAA